MAAMKSFGKRTREHETAGEVSIKKGRSQTVDRGRRDEMTREGDKTKFRTQKVKKRKGATDQPSRRATTVSSCRREVERRE